VDRIRISQIGQATRSLQRTFVVREEAGLIVRQVCAASAASQAEPIASATTHIERASSRIVCLLLIQAQVAARPREIATLPEAISSETTACGICGIRVAVPGLLLLSLQDDSDITLDSRTSSSKSTPATYSTAIALDTASFSVSRRIFFSPLHLYDFILKGRKRASFNKAYGTANVRCGGI